MSYPRRGLPITVVPVFIAVAIFGYLLGRSRSESPPVEGNRVALGGGVVIEHPPAWRPGPGAPAIPRLALSQARVLAPNGSAVQAGLLVGTLSQSELAPLPRTFIESLPSLPETKIVNLVEVQAYRYAKLLVPGFDKALTLFVIPDPGGAATALACYAPSASSPFMRACESAVASVTVQAQSRVFELTPEASYASRISTSISVLDRLRVALERQLRGQVTAAQAQKLAIVLANGFADLSATLSELEPEPSAQRAQAALSAAAAQARAGYTALAAAAGAHDVPAYITAQKRIADAEAGVDWTLENYALLGYSSPSTASAVAHS